MEDSTLVWVIIGVVVGIPGAVWATIQIRRHFKGRPAKHGSESPGPEEPETVPEITETVEAFPDFFNRINQVFASKVRLYRLLSQEPTLDDRGLLEVNDQVRKTAAHLRTEYNEPQALLDPLPDWGDDPPIWQIKKLKYAVAAAMRHLDQMPPVLSANTIIVCNDRKAIYVQRRWEVAERYQYMVHTFGGAYVSNIEGDTVEHDSGSLVRTAKREVFHESGGQHIDWAGGPMLVSAELSTGYIQLVLMGATITANQAKSMVANPEGKPLEIKCSELQDWILHKTDQWVPTGLAHILCWLALGAPGSDGACWGRTESPRDIFRHVIDRIDANKLLD